MNNKIINILLSLGKVDRKIIFIIIGLVVFIPLANPDWINIPIQPSPDSQKVFDELSKLEPGSKVLVSFDYGPSTKPEIHPMSVALLKQLFAQEVKVYIMALWPDGVFMSKDALNQVLDTYKILGCILIFVGVVLVQLSSLYLKKTFFSVDFF